MPVHATWHDEDQRIISCQFVGNWNMKQYRHAWKRCYELLLEQKDERVDFVIDLRESILIPPDFIRQLRQLPFNPQPNIGLIVFVGADIHIQLLVENIFKSILHLQGLEFADTVEDAAARINEARREPVALSA